jgi:hypothetical protein
MGFRLPVLMLVSSLNPPLPVLLFECISRSSGLTNFLQFPVQIEL